MNNLSQEERNYRNFLRLMMSKESKDNIQAYSKIIYAGMNLTMQSVPSYLFAAEDALFLFDMTIMKCHTILKLHEQIPVLIKGKKAVELSDPFSIFSLVRTQLEAFCVFNNIWVQHKGEQTQLLYKLWKLAGLKDRQTFQTNEATKDKKTNEAQQISNIIQEIKESTTYIELDDKGKRAINDAIEAKNYKLSFTKGTVKRRHWKDLFIQTGISTQHLEDIYTLLTQYSHPTYISVIQLKVLYTDKNYLYFMKTAIGISKYIISLFISDFCSVFDYTKSTFDKEDVVTQNLINFYNRMFRSESFSITDTTGVINDYMTKERIELLKKEYGL